MSIIANLFSISRCVQYDNALQRVMSVTITSRRNNRFGRIEPKTACVRDIKRRKTWPFFWWPTKKKGDVPYKDNITYGNRLFVDQYVKDMYELKDKESPIKGVELEREKYEPGSTRTGLIARIIGHYPMWQKDGKKIVCAALHVVDNHVIKYHTPQEYEQICRPFDRVKHHTKGKAVVVVGAEDADPRNFPAVYRGLFKEAGVMPKNKLTRFYVTENGRIAPGTRIYATHFRVGDYVDVWGTSRDWKWQGVIKRWNFKGLPRYHGVTKAHRRGGTIGHGRKLQPLKGTKMPGHMGSERRVHRGYKVVRINTKYNVIWIEGIRIPGTINHWVYLYDTCIPKKRYSPDNPPPWPTHFPDESNEVLPENIFDKAVHSFDEPTLIFEETEEERKATLMALKSKKAKVAKIR